MTKYLLRTTALATLALALPAVAQTEDAPFTTFNNSVTVTPGGGGVTKACSSLQTLFASNNGGSAGGAVLFDVDVVKAGGIMVASIDTNTDATAGTPVSIDLYTTPGTYVGNETNMGVWNLVSSGSGVAAGLDNPTSIDLADFALAPGTYGICLVMGASAGHNYSGTSSSPPPTTFSNADLTITGGAALNVPFSGTPFSPRMWNGEIFYDCTVTPPATFCKSRPSSLPNCTPALSAASNTASKTGGTGTYDITAGPVPGGILPAILIFSDAPPTAPVTTQFGDLCLSPFFRAGAPQFVAFSGGTSGVCDGSYVFDGGDIIAFYSQIAAGDAISFQAWYRDPGNSGTANYTHGIGPVSITP